MSDFDPAIRNASWWSGDSRMAAQGKASQAILIKQGNDPSNYNGRTAKMIIDATKPRPDFSQRHTLPADAIERAKALLREVL